MPKVIHALIPLAACAAISLGTIGAAAADVVGTWRTLPDQNGHVANVRAAPCGAAICGTIVQVFDETGALVDAPTVGQKVFWDMTREGANYVGRAFVPAHQRTYAGSLSVEGDELTVRGCLGPICQSQVWQRVP